MQLVQSLLFLTYLISCNLVLATPRYEDIDDENTQLTSQGLMPQDSDRYAVSISLTSRSNRVALTDLPPINTLCHQLMVDVVSHLDVVSIAHVSLTQKSWSHLITDPQVWRNIHWRKYMQGLKQGVWTQPFETFLKDIAIHLEDDPDKIYEMIKAKRRPPKNLAEQYNPYHEPIYFWSTRYKLYQNYGLEYDVLNWVVQTWEFSKQELIDRGMGYGISNVPYFRVKQLTNENSDSEQSIQHNTQARELIDKMIQRGSIKFALYFKANGLAEGEPPYTQDDTALQKFVTNLPTVNPAAFDFLRVEGLANGKYGFNKDPDAAQQLNEQLIKQGFELAVRNKIDDFEYANSGYSDSKISYVTYIDSLIEQDYRPAFHKKVFALSCGSHGFSKDFAAARYLNERLVKLHNEEAIEKKILSILHGYAGYQKDITDGQYLMNDMIGFRNVLGLKLSCLSYGYHNYEKNVTQAQQCIEEQVKLKNQHAIEFKIVGMMLGWYGYEKDPNSIYQFIDELADKDNIYAQYLKSIGLRYGIFGYPCNVLAAKRYIRQHCIPYYLI